MSDQPTPRACANCGQLDCRNELHVDQPAAPTTPEPTLLTPEQWSLVVNTLESLCGATNPRVSDLQFWGTKAVALIEAQSTKIAALKQRPTDSGHVERLMGERDQIHEEAQMAESGGQNNRAKWLADEIASQGMEACEYLRDEVAMHLRQAVPLLTEAQHFALVFNTALPLGHHEVIRRITTLQNDYARLLHQRDEREKTINAAIVRMQHDSRHSGYYDEALEWLGVKTDG